jgi:hypothetical protein
MNQFGRLAINSHRLRQCFKVIWVIIARWHSWFCFTLFTWLVKLFSKFLFVNPVDTYACMRVYNWVLYMPYVTEKRQDESSRIREKYPDRIPVSFLFFLLVIYFPFPIGSVLIWGSFLVCGTGHCWEGWEEWHPGHWQEKVSFQPLEEPFQCISSNCLKKLSATLNFLCLWNCAYCHFMWLNLF